jgi:putative ABC transport system ATP-binding protein
MNESVSGTTGETAGASSTVSDGRGLEPVVRVSGLGKQVAGVDDAVLRADSPLVILHEISFCVAAGETVAIVGASGSGKSTLLGLLAGLDSPTSGNVFIGGREISRLDEDARAVLRGQMLGFVFQSFQLLPSLTAIENVMLPLELAGQRSAASEARAWLERVGLGERLRHYPKHLSGGEQQRVALARAFATGPKLILADEPTGNLDAATGHQIIDLMFAINAERGTTLILVTHDEEIAARCGRRLRMHAGRLEELERHSTCNP